MSYLSIIIPAYNEASRLPQTLEKLFTMLQAQQYSSEVILVENGSQDSTYKIAQDYSKIYKNLRVLQMPNKGKGGAVRKGMLEATGDYRLICDADISMPVEEINLFLPPICNNDITIGSREVYGATRYNEPIIRHISGRFFNMIVRAIILPGIQDTQCGFKCFSSRTIENIFRHQTLMGWSFDVEILYIARLHGYSIIERPISWYYNTESKVRLFQDSWQMLKDVLQIRKNAYQGMYSSKEIS